MLRCWYQNAGGRTVSALGLCLTQKATGGEEMAIDQSLRGEALTNLHLLSHSKSYHLHIKLARFSSKLLACCVVLCCWVLVIPSFPPN